MEYRYDEAKLALQVSLKRGHSLVPDGLLGTSTLVLTSEIKWRVECPSGSTALHDECIELCL